MKPRTTRGKLTPVTTEIAERIKKWAKPEFDPEVLSFPLGLCCSCRRQLSESEKKGATSPGVKAKWDDFKLQNIHIPRGQEARSCSCDICIARRTEFFKVKIVPRGEPQEEKEEKKENKKGPCGICLQEKTGPGIRHPCGPTARKHNLAKLTLQEGRGAEQVAACVVKTLAEQKKTEVGAPIQLQQLKGGKALTITVGQKRKRKEIQVKSQTVAKIKKEAEAE